MSIHSTEMTQIPASAIPKKGRAEFVSWRKSPPALIRSKKPLRSMEPKPANVSGTKQPPKADEREVVRFATDKKPRRSPKPQVTQATTAIVPREANEPAAGVTKQERMLTLLSRPEGATIDEMMQATNWQQHSVRGFLAGTVKRKLGFSLTSAKPDEGGRRYRIETRRVR